MNCEGARELFSDYVEGCIDPAIGRALQAHIDECVSCRRELDDFRKTWGALCTLPEMAPPVNFRHDIVMRVARMEHEKEQSHKQHSVSFVFGSFFKRLIPARTAKLAWIVAVMILVVSGIPERAINHARQWMAAGPVMQSAIEDNSNVVTQPSQYDGVGGEQSDIGSKQEWQSRRVGRNSIWISVDPKQDRDGRMVYRVLLSINEKSLAKGDICGRIGAEVYLLPPDQYGLVDGSGVSTVWQGSILRSNPVLVPVIIDRAQSDRGTVNLLVTWKFRGRSFAQIVYIPAGYNGGLSNDVYDLSLDSTRYIKNRNDLYSALQRISQDYGVIIIANGEITDVYPMVYPGAGNLEQTLQSTLKPVGMDWLKSDHAMYIDRKYL